MGRGQRENGLQLTCLESLRTGLLLPPSREPDGGNMPHEVEPAAHWAQQAAGQPGPSYTLPPSRGASPGTSKLQWLRCAEQGTTSRSAWREGRRHEEGNNPIVIPQITDWDGRGGGGKLTLFT